VRGVPWRNARDEADEPAGASAFYYVCRDHRVRGNHLCTNSLSAPMTNLHSDLVEQLRRDVLSPSVFEDVLGRALELERSPEKPDRRAALTDELARLDREIARFTEAVAQGGSCLRS
jgi:hypothetical protein